MQPLLSSIQTELKAFLDKITSGDGPPFTFGGGGLLLLLVAFKVGKGGAKMILYVLALALIAVGVVWYVRNHQ
jgi:hypothetical protein